MTSEARAITTRSAWPRAIVVFFLILVVGNGALLYLAIDSQHGYLEKQPYERGLRYQETIDQHQKASDAGLRVGFSFSAPDEQGIRSVSLRLSGLSAAGITTDKVQLFALRYSDGGLDSEGELKSVGAETFEGEIKLPLSGLWLFRTKLRAGESDYLIEQEEMLD